MATSVAPAPVSAPAATPAAAPAAPVVPAAVPAPTPVDLTNETFRNVMDRIVKRPIPQDAVEAAPAVADVPRETSVAQPGTAQTPVSETATTGEAISAATPEQPIVPAMVGEIKADEPEGEVILRARDPQTGQFSDMDQTRTYELSIKDKQTKETKVYNKTLPDLMRMAADSIGMKRSQVELQVLRQKVPQYEQVAQQAQQRTQGLEALALELLTADEATVVARREAYALENTPEKVYARRAQELEQQRQLFQQQQAQGHLQQQISILSARVGTAMQEVDGLVGQDMAAGKLLRDTMPLYVNGQIPPQHFPQLEAYINGPYREWAKAEAAKITKERSAAETARQLQQRAQAAVNAVGQATRPIGVTTGGNDAPAKAPVKSANEMIDRIISRPLTTMGAGSG